MIASANATPTRKHPTISTTIPTASIGPLAKHSRNARAMRPRAFGTTTVVARLARRTPLAGVVVWTTDLGAGGGADGGTEAGGATDGTCPRLAGGGMSRSLVPSPAGGAEGLVLDGRLMTRVPFEGGLDVRRGGAGPSSTISTGGW